MKELKTIKVDHETWKVLKRLSLEKEKSIGNLIKEKFLEVKEMKSIQTFDLNFEEAKNYFDADADNLEFLESLSKDEKENYHLRITINHDNQSAYYEAGNYEHESEHLALFNDRINNTTPTEDDYDGVVDFLKEYELL